VSHGPRTYRLWRGGFDVALSCPPDVPASLIGELHHYRVTPGGAGRAGQEVVIRYAGTARAALERRRLVLELPRSELSRQVLQVAVDQAFTRRLDDEGIAVFHAATVSTGGTTLLLWGPPGAGKTSTALALHLCGGWHVASNGSTMVRLADGGPAVVGSAKGNLRIRRSSLEQMARALGDVPAALAGAVPMAAGDSRSPFEEKVDLPLSLLGDPLPTPLAVTALVAVRLVAGLDDARLEPMDRARASVQLLTDAVRIMHGAEAVLLRRDGRLLCHLPSIRTEAGHGRRRALVEGLVERAFTASGPLAAVADLLDRRRWPLAPAPIG
jgi:hypothetical protein